MSDHNFYDSLVEFSASNPLRLCMPGHKGKGLPMEEWGKLTPLDFTELPPTGNLYAGDDWLEEAQRLWAWDWGMGAAFFATAGSTQGLFTLLRCFTRAGDAILMDRVSHKSLHHAMALFDLRPVWLHRDWDAANALAGPVNPAAVKRALTLHPEISAVVVTSPTYFGVCSDLAALARVCHAHGAKLLVDGAHGAHLPLVLQGEENCILGHNPYQDCDGVTLSTHKTLPAPGQTAVVLANGMRLSDLRQAAELTSTTSPSFPMLAALDCLRPWMEEHKGAYRKIAAACADLRRQYPAITGDNLDPCRLVLQVEDGYALEGRLQEMGIYPELADNHHVVCIFTAADNERDLLRFKRALNFLGLKGAKPYAAQLPPPPEPETVCAPREAVFSPDRKPLPLERAEGTIAAQCVAPYPPGVPVLAPGERVTKKILAYLRDLCYDGISPIMTMEDPRRR